MLRIRQEQLEALEHARRLDFQSRLAIHLQNRKTEIGIPESPSCEEIAASLLSLALECGFRTEDGVVRFAETVLRCGLGLSESEWPNDALALVWRYGRPESERLDALARWADARRSSRT